MTAPHSSACDDLRGELAAIASGDPDTARALDVVSHLEDCAGCRSVLAADRSLLALLSAHEDLPELRSIVAAPSRATASKPPLRWLPSPWLRGGVAAAAVFALLSAFGAKFEASAKGAVLTFGTPHSSSATESGALRAALEDALRAQSVHWDQALAQRARADTEREAVLVESLDHRFVAERKDADRRLLLLAMELDARLRLFDEPLLEPTSFDAKTTNQEK